jgi:uracil-DNA glycosylase
MGEWARNASVILVGEQPGDKDDLQGHPFAGPAGQVLDRGIQEVGIPADDVYMTNVVKHFRYNARASAGSARPTAGVSLPALAAMSQFVADLERVASWLRRIGSASASSARARSRAG